MPIPRYPHPARFREIVGCIAFPTGAHGFYKRSMIALAPEWKAQTILLEFITGTGNYLAYNPAGRGCNEQ
ncbi:hypothetical protein KKH18_06860 [bacterium]|nr:hypothetical protein [bacterium]